jgi:hypothetical protein
MLYFFISNPLNISAYTYTPIKRAGPALGGKGTGKGRAFVGNYPSLGEL